MATVRVGISGWRYPRWRGDFYPSGLVQRRELAYVAERMPTVELNGSFYSLQRPASYRRWRDETPDGFVFAVKGSRYVSHMLRLHGVETVLANFFASGVLALGPKLGPVLWQLPERLAFEPEVLEAFVAGLPRTTGEALELARRHDARVDGRSWLEIEADRPIRYAFEPRHPSWLVPEFARIARDTGTAIVFSDSASWPATEEITAGFVYLRLHGATQTYASGYSGAGSLDRWAERVRGWVASGEDVHCYFDNDAEGHAPHDAVRLLGRVRGSGV